ncbi:MAG: hypothetical protein KatS3mg102_2448 [Planctomycetota bacterium]|nr:MAG: hypothetical protein KatS3mg102_2448 [Planctomycetota bacterium]
MLRERAAGCRRFRGRRRRHRPGRGRLWWRPGCSRRRCGGGRGRAALGLRRLPSGSSGGGVCRRGSAPGRRCARRGARGVGGRRRRLLHREQLPHRLAQGRRRLGCALVTAFLVLREQLPVDGFERGGRLRQPRAQRGRLGEQVLAEQLAIAAAKRQFARQHLVEHDAERVQIGAPVDLAEVLALALQLLRRHVGRGADAVRRRIELDGDGAGQRAHLRDTEVHDLGMPVREHAHVRRLEVAVVDVACVGVLQRRQHLEQDRDRTRQRQLPAGLLQHLAQVLAVEQLVRQVVAPHLGAVAEQPADVRVVQPPGRLDLAPHAEPDLIRAGEHDLERDVGAAVSHVGVDRAPDLPHAALAERLDEAERSEAVAGSVHRRACSRLALPRRPRLREARACSLCGC